MALHGSVARTDAPTRRRQGGRITSPDGCAIRRRRGDRKLIIAPEGGDARAPVKPRPDETLIRALARAHRWQRLLDDGWYRSAGEPGEAERVARSFVNRLLRLTLLAPDIIEAILDGRQPKATQLESLT